MKNTRIVIKKRNNYTRFKKYMIHIISSLVISIFLVMVLANSTIAIEKDVSEQPSLSDITSVLAMENDTIEQPSSSKVEVLVESFKPLNNSILVSVIENPAIQFEIPNDNIYFNPIVGDILTVNRVNNEIVSVELNKDGGFEVMVLSASNDLTHIIDENYDRDMENVSIIDVSVIEVNHDTQTVLLQLQGTTIVFELTFNELGMIPTKTDALELTFNNELELINVLNLCV